ncbi:MAG: homoserine dehydrogenase [Pedosphaera sp.]|nr:homoserine dehydrogenase [Pedosphaera sp.]
MYPIHLGIIGAGTVGGGLLQALARNGSLMASRLGVEFIVTRVAVRNSNKARLGSVPVDRITTDWREVVNDPDVQVVVELIGGTTTAREIVLTALRLGKPVITANKALLSAHGPELFAAAAKHGTNLYYEASVAGGIPIIKILRESFAGNRILSIHGIVNGTCNYILTRMKLEGAVFADVLADAQRMGYAEAEPSLDIDGHDAAHKTGILASLAHGRWVRPEQIHTEGIRHLSKLDIEFASQLGYTIKLLGVVKLLNSTKKARPAELKGRVQSARPQVAVQVSVYPALVPNSHVLASVNFAFNAISVRGDVVGETLFYGRGAGQDPTASSVLSDLADAALDLKHGSTQRVPPFVPHATQCSVVPLAEVISRYYLRLSVADRPGVLAKIASVLGKARIGISSVIQPEGHEGEVVPLILMIHDATNAAMQTALARIARLSVVKAPPVMIRVEAFS